MKPNNEFVLSLYNGLVNELRRASGYAARTEIERILNGITDPRRLERYGRKVYSQNDEDGIIEEIFLRIMLGGYVGTFCEIGVGTGLECNSLYLLHRGWSGTWFDSDAKQANAIKSKFSSLIASQQLRYSVVEVSPSNINVLLDFQGDIDFLSIDVDGIDIHLLKAITSRPKVICIEYNAKFPPPLSRVPVYNQSLRWNGGDYVGASLTALDDAAEAMGYTLVGTNITGLNAFFVRNDLTKDMFASGGVTALYNPPRYWLSYDAFLSVGHPADFGPYEP